MRWIFIVLCCWSMTLLAEAPAAKPQRIASGTVGTDEILFEILGKKGELSRIIAVSIFSDDPRYSFLSIPSSIKGRVGNSLEALLALKPDLAILASYNKQELGQQLKAAGIKVVIQEDFRDVEDIQKNILKLGELVDAEKEAKLLVEQMNDRIKKSIAKNGACQPSLLQYTSNDVLPGLETIFNNVAQQAGYRNILASKNLRGWAQISQEILVQLDPDFVVVSSIDAPDQAAFIKQLRSTQSWGKLRAVKEGRIIFIPDRLLYTVSHHVAALVEELAKHHRCPVKQ